ncbi:MAG: hypothetical protein J6S67_09855 [Methanobrevibacter sp.]|nr:hypothetical protein [Methanobrevibacter sp.]
MLRTENGEELYERNDITPELLNEITVHMMDRGTISGKNRTYVNEFMTMDIETTTYSRSTDPVAFTYSIAVYFDNKAFIFRYWKDYNWFIDELKKGLLLHKYYRLVCYVHNLPYEFQFMRDYMTIEEVFAVQPRKVVKCLSNSIEYRCSYKLTNMGLARFTESIPNLKHGKLSGDEFDYSKLRTPSTILSPRELDYIYNDVAGLHEALDFTIKNDEYNLGTIPLTSTGFVRNELRYAMKSNPKNRKDFLDTQLDQYTYGLLRTARRGGNTHCNPLYSCMELPDVTSMDMSSAYPAVMVECKFPMTKFLPIAPRRLTDFETYVDAYACILDLTFTNISVKTLSTIPYIAKAHCTGFPKNDTDYFRSDNGRVLAASTLSMVCTDIDYKIIKETYDFDIVECRMCYISEYKYLPNELRKTILRQYKDKTTLKDKDPYLYMKQKNKFNANFGCMLTDICQDEVVYHPNNNTPFTYERLTTYTEQLEKYYSNKNSFLSYQHGVWVTAHCRARLQKAINLLQYDMIYCDTDSVKFFDTSVNRLIFNELNDEIKREIAECGFDCSVEYKGKVYTLGLWEPDGDYKFFKSMGAKKYAYITAKDYDCDKDKIKCGKKIDCSECKFNCNGKCDWKKFQITVAGLSKSVAKEYMYDLAHGDAEAFMDIFSEETLIDSKHSGRTTALYNDYEKVRVLKIKETGETITVGSNMVIEDTTYQFGLTEDYKHLLTNINEGVIW